MIAALHDRTILVPESRELALFVRMLETEGATAVPCPLVQICDLEDTREAETWIAQLTHGRRYRRGMGHRAHRGVRYAFLAECELRRLSRSRRRPRRLRRQDHHLTHSHIHILRERPASGATERLNATSRIKS